MHEVFSLNVADSHLPSLNAIQSFAVAAKHLSFTAAAQELYVSQGAVSRMVRQLERETGVQLFRRVGRTLELTSQGAAYYAEVSAALERMTKATRTLRGLDRGNILSIAVLPTFALKRLVPKLSHFHERHADILVDIITQDGPPAFAEGGVDINICYGSGKWPNVETTLLFPEELGVYCSPQLFAHYPGVGSPNDLQHVPLLIHSTRPDAWNAYFAGYQIPAIDLQHYQRFEHFFMLVEAAAAGLGVALLPTFFAHDEVLAGRLIQVLPDMMHPREAYYIAHAAGAGSVRKIQLFKKWALEELARD